jgi:hypothetical protein
MGVEEGENELLKKVGEEFFKTTSGILILFFLQKMRKVWSCPLGGIWTWGRALGLFF